MRTASYCSSGGVAGIEVLVDLSLSLVEHLWLGGIAPASYPKMIAGEVILTPTRFFPAGAQLAPDFRIGWYLVVNSRRGGGEWVQLLPSLLPIRFAV
jgi:hypothetical protein